MNYLLVVQVFVRTPTGVNIRSVSTSRFQFTANLNKSVFPYETETCADNSSGFYWLTMSTLDQQTLKINHAAGNRVSPTMPVNAPPDRYDLFQFETGVNDWHVLAISQAICEYRKQQGIVGSLFFGIDAHALSVPAYVSGIGVWLPTAWKSCWQKTTNQMPCLALQT
ncbi:MAG: hypothetical protein ACYCSS_14055 [Sulfuriferula sp.]